MLNDLGMGALDGGRADELLRQRRLSMHAKRTLDVIVASTVLVVFAAPAALVALAIKCTSTGPVLFVQERVGRHGQRFGVIKFRTMRVGTDREIADNLELRAAYEANDFKLAADDSHITAIGRWLRSTSIDELPQLVNVLRGEMSLVGIRPLVVRELERRSVYERDCYYSMRPGMTGLWQVEGRSSLDHVDRRALDIRYVEYWSLRGDMRLLLRTPAAALQFSRTG